MTTENQRVYLTELSKRWQKSPDQVVEMAIQGKIDLWFEFTNVIVLRVKKKKTSVEPHKYPSIVGRPQAEILQQMIGRTDRMQVAAEYPCLNDKDKPVLISNAVGDEWGETSMIGLNPMRLYALTDELQRLERKHNIQPYGVDEAISCCCQAAQEATDDGELIPADHPCFAPELHMALECWLDMMADQEQADVVKKADILEWLHSHYPNLSKTAAERIARVVAPVSKRQS
ncbi:hypothetical protein [Desulfobulbus propionicus]